MAEEERPGNGTGERESRFANLLHPNRDMATNWSVDVGKQLENYLDEMKATGLFDDGDSPLNFAEAALLIQGSIQVYSKKVEYLYNLVVRALDYLAQKKQGQEGEKPSSSSQEDDQGSSDAVEDEENFLNLEDEIEEEADIDLLDEQELDSSHRNIEVPTCLLVTEGESLDLPGEAGELASYNIAKCTMYRNFLLLDPSDTATVDKYLKSDVNRRRENGDDPAVPSTSPLPGSSAAAENHFQTPGEIQTSGGIHTSGSMPTPGGVHTSGGIYTPGGLDTHEPDWQGDGDEGMMWDDPHVYNGVDGVSKDEQPAKEAFPTSEDDNYVDPWVPLNPHEAGSLPVKPWKKASTQRAVKPRKDGSSPASVAKRYGVFFPEFAKVLQAKERQDRAKRSGDELSKVKNAQNSFFRNGQTIETPMDSVHEDLGGEMGDSDNDYSAWDDFDAADHVGDSNGDVNVPLNTTQEQQGPSWDETLFTPRQDSPNVENGLGVENMSLEDLCRAHVDSVLQQLAESQARSGLTTRVTSWKNKIEATLKYDESRPPFDIHEYGDRLLATLSTSTATTREEDTEEIEKPFTYLVNGQPKEQVARSFSALLQLVNNGNVMIERGSVGNGSYCFSAEIPFRVKLLNSHNHHKKMFQHMIPPSGKKAVARSRVSQQTDTSGPSQRLRTPVLVSARCSPAASYTKTPRSGLRVGSSTGIFLSPSSVRRSTRKRGQSMAGKVSGAVDAENRGVGTPDKGYTPVKLTPNRRQSKRKPLQTIQV